MTITNDIPSLIYGAIDGSLKIPSGDFADDDLVRAELEFMVNAKPNSGHLRAILEKLQSGGSVANMGSIDKDYTIGLALSGGGIRSAIVSLGVMQRLAKTGLLAQVDYLSTVSGGGFIGSAVSWWLHNSVSNPKDAPVTTTTPFFDLGDNFPFGTESPESVDPHKSLPLKYLRENGRYLVPGNGHGVAAGIAVVLRAVFLNLLVWIPLVALVFLILNWIGTWSFVAGLPTAVATVAEQPMRALNGSLGSVGVVAVFPPTYLLLLLATVGVLAFFVIISINLSVQSWLERGENGKDVFESRFVTQWFTGASSPLRWLAALLICLPIAGIFLWVVRWVAPLAGPVLAKGSLPEGFAGKLFVHNLIFGVVVLLFGLWYFRGGNDAQARLRRKFVWVAITFFAVAALDLGLSVSPLLTDSSHWWAGAVAWVWAALAIVMATGFVTLWSFLLGHLIRNVLHSNDSSARYSARRRFEKGFGTALVVVVACLAVGVLPIIVGRINESVVAGPTASMSLVLGIASAIWGHYRTYLRGLGGKATGLTLMIGSLLLLYGIMIFGYMIAAEYQDAEAAMPRVIILALITVSVITAWFTNLNYLSLHRFYRDRLAEAFMPDFKTTEPGVNAAADGADSLPIAAQTEGEIDKDKDLDKTGKTYNCSGTKGLFHIINSNVILERSPQRKYRSRGGDNFMLSPLYCGSNATGWQRSAEFAGGELTLASAMAISGAAANPRSGMVGTGATRNTLVSLAMSVLSLRLGYWVTRPPARVDEPDQRKTFVRRANHLFPSAWYAITKRGYSETSNFLELTDGGHFENLGIYELVRRRCGLIVVCDGGQDPDSSYQSLTYAALRVKEDFGAMVKFNVELKDATKADAGFLPTSPGELVARKVDNEFPKDAEFAKRGFFLASVDYGERGGGTWPKQGLIIYMKSAMIADLGLVARGYKGAFPEFPYQSTSDQFFEPDQFEAYREVGHKICAQMLEQTGLLDLFIQKNSPVSRPPNGWLQDGEHIAIRTDGGYETDQVGVKKRPTDSWND